MRRHAYECPVCQSEQSVLLPDRDTGATSREFGQYLMSTVEDPSVEARWDEYAKSA